MILSGWGRYPRLNCRVSAPRSVEDLAARVAEGGLIARGNGRAYGDSATSAANTVSMRHFNRMQEFDAEKGLLVAEAGVILGDVISAFLPQGWFPAVTPGTKFVTLGGMIAADVHGKNHHRVGGLAKVLDWIEVMGPDGTVTRATRRKGAALFKATLGGMGLTGPILRAGLRLQPVESGWIRQETIAAPNLGAAMDVFEERADAPYSVAWIDCLAEGPSTGRSLVMLGEHAAVDDLPRPRRKTPFATPGKRRLSVPLDLPGFALSGPTVRAFNAMYYNRGVARAGTALVDWDSYFYPLDAILGWNRIYGRRGFVQFQCLLPPDAARAGLEALLGATSSAGLGSFLAVLKKLGPSEGRLSFPAEGYTLALDFPAHPRALALMAELDRITLDHGGRFYLAKDARLTAQTFHAADPRAAAFRKTREGDGTAAAFASTQSERLQL